MTESNTPPGVDPALWREFQALSDQVHELHRQRRDEEKPDPPTRRMVVDVPQKWFLPFAWIEKRQRAWLHGDNGPTYGATIRMSFARQSR